MHYDRLAVNLILEIKRSLPSHLQNDFKLASPDLIDKVKDIFLTTKNDNVKALAAQFLEIAGVKEKSLTKSDSSLLGRLTNTASFNNKSEEPNPAKVTVKMYRGQPVYD